MCTSIYGKFLILSIWSIENVHWGRVILDIFSIKLYGQKLYYKITFGFINLTVDIIIEQLIKMINLFEKGNSNNENWN